MTDQVSERSWTLRQMRKANRLLTVGDMQRVRMDQREKRAGTAASDSTKAQFKRWRDLHHQLAVRASKRALNRRGDFRGRSRLAAFALRVLECVQELLLDVSD